MCPSQIFLYCSLQRAQNLRHAYFLLDKATKVSHDKSDNDVAFNQGGLTMEMNREFTLREWRYEDAEEIVIVANNPKIAGNLRNTFPSPYLLEDAKWYVNDCISKEGKNQITRAIVVDGKTVGSIGIFIKDDVYEKSGELGYWLAEDYWRQGITSQAARMICREAFDRFDIIRIFAEPFEYNQGSRGVLEKAGFTYEGTMRNGIYKNGRVHSYCMYSLLREEFSI